MKRFLLLTALLAALPLALPAQDAATEERLNRLQNQIETLQQSNVDLQKKLSDVQQELQELRQQVAKPPGNFADAADVKNLADAIKEVDRKRMADHDLTVDELKKLRAILTDASARRTSRPPDDTPKTGSTSSGPERGYEYVIQSGDTLSSVVSAYRDKGVKITVEDVLKANPSVKPTSLRVGQKIFIPAQ